MKMKSRINTFLAKEVLIDLDNISRDNAISSNNKKVELMQIVLNKYGIDYTAIAPGTNRYSILIDNYVFKLALDKRGKVDNWSEFYLSKLMYPYVTKTYECNGLIAVAEYVKPLNKEEFISNKSEIRKILNILSEDWLFGDMGTITKNFMNWGLRGKDNYVCLDYAYTYHILGNEMICGNKKKNGEICESFLEYDEDFTMIKCPECGKKYDFIDIRNRMRRNYEDEIREKVKKLTVQFPQGVEELEVEDLDIDSINTEEDNTMNYYEDNSIKYTEEDIDAMLTAEIENCYAPIKISEIEEEPEMVKPTIDMNAANEIMEEVLISENDYEEEEPISKEMVAKRKFERIVEEMSAPEEYYDGYDDDDWIDDPDIAEYYNDSENVVTEGYPDIDNIIDEVYENTSDEVVEHTTSTITIIDDNCEESVQEEDELGDAIFDYFTNNPENEVELDSDKSTDTEELVIEEDIDTILDNGMDDIIDDMISLIIVDDDDSDEIDDEDITESVIDNETPAVQEEVIDIDDTIEEEIITIAEEVSIETTVDETPVVEEEKPVSSFIKVLDEDNNESIDDLRSSLLDDDEYDDQYDELYDQVAKDKKIYNKRNY